jgi:hypothetical protein
MVFSLNERIKSSISSPSLIIIKNPALFYSVGFGVILILLLPLFSLFDYLIISVIAWILTAAIAGYRSCLNDLTDQYIVGAKWAIIAVLYFMIFDLIIFIFSLNLSNESFNAGKIISYFVIRFILMIIAMIIGIVTRIGRTIIIDQRMSSYKTIRPPTLQSKLFLYGTGLLILFFVLSSYSIGGPLVSEDQENDSNDLNSEEFIIKDALLLFSAYHLTLLGFWATLLFWEIYHVVKEFKLENQSKSDEELDTGYYKIRIGIIVGLLTMCLVFLLVLLDPPWQYFFFNMLIHPYDDKYLIPEKFSSQNILNFYFLIPWQWLSVVILGCLFFYALFEFEQIKGEEFHMLPSDR